MRPGSTLALSGARSAIDCVDGAMIAMLAGRCALARASGRLKRDTGLPTRDAAREAVVRWRAEHLAVSLGVSRDCAGELATLMIAEGLRQQSDTPSTSRAWMRLFALVPRPLLEFAVQRVFSLALSAPHGIRAFESVQRRRIGIEVSDLGLSWVLELRGGELRVSHEPAEATVRGSAADLLSLAGRLEDADTLFFQRKLVLTGDVELGLTVRNLLDRMPWESIPLGLRIALRRGGRYARGAHDHE